MKDVIVKIYPNMINQFIDHPGRFQKIIIGGACRKIHHNGTVQLPYLVCEACANEKEYLYLHFNVTGSSSICIGEIIDRSDI